MGQEYRMWSYIAGGLKIEVIYYADWQFRIKYSDFIIKEGIKIKCCKI